MVLRAFGISFAILVSLLIAADPVFAQSFNGVARWQYLPINENLIKGLDKTNGFDNSVIGAAMEQKQSKKGSIDEGEARVALAEMCWKSGFRYCAYHYALTTTQDFPGSMPALRALGLLEQVVMAGPWNENKIQQMINNGSFKEIPDQLLPMTAYYVAMNNSDRKLTSWVQPPLKQLGDKNFWSVRWRFLAALEETRRKTTDLGIKRLEPLMAQAAELAPDSWLKQDIEWQLARMRFETGDFDNSLKLYEELPTAGRLGGRVMFERAWVHFYRGEFAQTLGLLHSLKAPWFMASTDPEQFLLEMLTLRKLCNFGAVNLPAKNFRERYQASIEHVRLRRPMSNNLALTRLNFVEPDLLPTVETVAVLRDEKGRFKKASVPSEFREEMNHVYDRDEAELREDLEIEMKKTLPQVARRLLEQADQIELVDYLSGLDAFRTQQAGPKENYVAATASSTDFETLFWPVANGEFWSDELKNYRVLVKDRCSERGKQ